MRKRLIGQDPPRDQEWLDVDHLAQVEVSSEDPDRPVEFALVGGGPGWRASTPGEQLIRLLFDEPVKLRTIAIRFDEPDAARTQEFALRWSPDRGRSYREVVRQQYNFSPPDTTCQAERYAVEVDGATVLELRIVPDIARGPALASLTQLRLA